MNCVLVMVKMVSFCVDDATGEIVVIVGVSRVCKLNMFVVRVIVFFFGDNESLIGLVL